MNSDEVQVFKEPTLENSIERAKLIEAVKGKPLISAASNQPLKEGNFDDLPWDRPPMVMFGDDLTSAEHFWRYDRRDKKIELEHRILELAKTILGFEARIERGWYLIFPQGFGREPHNHIKFGSVPDLVCTSYLLGSGIMRIHDQSGRIRQLETTPGTMLFMNGSTVHSVPKNTQAETRHVIVSNLIKS